MLTVPLAPWGDEARIRACHVVVGKGLPTSSALAPYGGRVARCVEVTLAGTPTYYLDPAGEVWAAVGQAVTAGAALSSERLDIKVPDAAVTMVLEDGADSLRAALEEAQRLVEGAARWMATVAEAARLSTPGVAEAIAVPAEPEAPAADPEPEPEPDEAAAEPPDAVQEPPEPPGAPSGAARAQKAAAARQARKR